METNGPVRSDGTRALKALITSASIEPDAIDSFLSDDELDDLCDAVLSQIASPGRGPTSERC